MYKILVPKALKQVARDFLADRGYQLVSPEATDEASPGESHCRRGRRHRPDGKIHKKCDWCRQEPENHRPVWDRI